MKITFRCDAAIHIGTGHVMRCLTLAAALSDKYKASISFICRAHDGHLANKIKQSGFDVFLLPKNSTFKAGNYPEHAAWLGDDWMTDADQSIGYLKKLGQQDWLIVDHYAIDARWHQKVRFFTKKIMVIDDLADRQLDCDLLLDQNFYRNMFDRYCNKVGKKCLQLLGPSHCLLRKEFFTVNKAKWRELDPRVLLFFGGSDLPNTTTAAIIAILPVIDLLGHVDVVVGESNPRALNIQDVCNKHVKLHYHFATNCISQLMQSAQLFIGAVGSTTWERCSLGLPAIVVTNANNQVQLAKDLHELGSHIYLGSFFHEKGMDPECHKQIFNVLQEHSVWLKMQQVSLALTDGLGILRIVKNMEKVVSGQR